MLYRWITSEWYGRNARGTWLVSRSVTTSKINTNVAVEYYPPIASPNLWRRASLEKATVEAIQSGASLSENIERHGQTWTGLKAEQYVADRAAEKEKEEFASPVEKPGRSNGSGKRSSISLASISASSSTMSGTERQSGSNHSPLQPFTPLSPPTSTKSFAATDPAPVVALETTPGIPGQSIESPRRTPSERVRTNGGGRARSSTSSGPAHGGSTSSNSRGRNSNTAGGHRDGRGRGGSSSGKSGGGPGARRTSTANGGGTSTRNGGGGGRGHGSGRGGGRRKVPTATT
jgi:hypothetical protein